MSDKRVEVGDTVRFGSLVKLQDGSVVQESSVPITIEFGTGRIIKGLYNEMLGEKVYGLTRRSLWFRR
jgi:FKBP-type peptidyl-prolyl cis-trans isomerase 2